MIHQIQMRLAIVGSRKYQNYDFFKIQMKKYIETVGVPTTIISGGASGIDTLAEKWANEHGMSIIVYKADWNRYGKSAGPMRNSQIVDDCTHVLAFPDKESIGTWDTVRKAQTANKVVQIITLP